MKGDGIMKKLTAIALALVMLLALTACEKQPETEVKYLPLEVTHEMAPDYTVKYVYQYDENWNQTLFTEYVNDEPENETSYIMDLENKQILKIISTSPDGSTFEIEYKNTYDPKGNLILREQFSEGILAISTEYTYDADGNMLSITQKNPSNSSTSILTYDGNGHLLRMENIMEAVGERAASRAWTEYTYDENGNQIQSVNYYNNGENRTTQVTEYDDLGRKTKQVVTDDYGGTETIRNIHSFTWEGNTETETICGVAGNVLMTCTRTYDDAGNLLVSENNATGDDFVQRTTYTWQKVELPVK